MEEARQQLTTTVSANHGGQMSERIELLHLARARHRQQTGDSEHSGLAPIAKHDLAPLHCRTQRAFGAVTVASDRCRESPQTRRRARSRAHRPCASSQSGRRQTSERRPPRASVLAIGSMAGLIAVDHRLMFQSLFEFLARCIHRLARLLPSRLLTAQTDRDVQRIFQRRSHQPRCRTR